jgi:hypothetical protein
VNSKYSPIGLFSTFVFRSGVNGQRDMEQDILQLFVSDLIRSVQSKCLDHRMNRALYRFNTSTLSINNSLEHQGMNKIVMIWIHDRSATVMKDLSKRDMSGSTAVQHILRGECSMLFGIKIDAKPSL